MSIGLDAVNLEQAVRECDVPRSSAYAVWSTDEVYAPQQMFQMAVLRRAVDGRRETIEQIHMLIEALDEAMGGSPPSFAELRELIRIGTVNNTEAVAASHSWQLVIALRAILHSAPKQGQDEELASWMTQNEEDLRIESIETIYKPMAELFHLRPRPEYGERAWQYMEIAASSMSEGLALRVPLRAAQYVDGLPHHAIENSGNDWSIFSLVFEQLVFIFFERKDGKPWPTDALSADGQAGA